MEIRLPCPPLREWLPTLLADKRVGAWAGAKTPRSIRPTLAEWPTLAAKADGAPASVVELSELDALIFGVRLERAEPPEACLELLRPGTLVIELAQPRRRLLRRLLGLRPRPQRVAEAGQSRVLQWLARGYHGLEQWESVDPHGIVVTLARVR